VLPGINIHGGVLKKLGSEKKSKAGKYRDIPGDLCFYVIIIGENSEGEKKKG